MKKLIITTLATTVVALGAFAQGSLTSVQGMWSSDGITTPGANSSNPALAATGLYYTGNANIELFYAANPAVTQAQINAINALDGTAGGGAAALALMNSDGFTAVSATTTAGSTQGSINYAVLTGSFTGADANTIGLLSPTPTSATAATSWIAMYAVGNGGSFNGFSGVLAWAQATGGNPTTSPAGIAAAIVHDPDGLNLVLTSVPEPTTIALAGLGGLSLLAFRRRNKA